jgi:HD-GYP domain-containing protein (c-di-GMP phosphodiesterase class II)
MSSDPPSAAPSPAPEPGGADRAALLRERGAPLLEALGEHSPVARDHSESTAAYAFAAAAELGCDRPTCDLVREAARLHEIGLVYGSESGLGGHQDEAYRLAHNAALDEGVCTWLLQAGERFDGGGAQGAGGDGIAIEARLIRVACAFHRALIEPPDDDTRAPHVRGIERLRAQAGAELDPRAVEALVAVVERAAV